LKVDAAGAKTEGELEDAFESLSKRRVAAIIISADAYFNNRRQQIVALADRFLIPAIYSYREFAVAGGLMSYGPDISDAYRLTGVYAGRILKGEKPSDLPVQLATRFELVINLRTAKTLGLEVPDRFLAIADEVIE
jgi:putative ABC transport system substrate-binding protein